MRKRSKIALLSSPIFGKYFIPGATRRGVDLMEPPYDRYDARAQLVAFVVVHSVPEERGWSTRWSYPLLSSILASDC